MYNDSLITYYTLAAVLKAHILYTKNKKKTNTRKKRPLVFVMDETEKKSKIKITLGG